MLVDKNMVFVLSICPPTPCANLPNSFAPALVQISLRLGSQYLSCFLVSKSRTGLADSCRPWATRSAMDDNGGPLLRLTLSAIDLDEITVGWFRMVFGCCCHVDTVEDSTINWGGDSASKGISSLPPMLNCTLGGASNCTLGGASICYLGEWAWSGNWFPGRSASVSPLIASICVLPPRFLPPLIAFDRSWIALITRSSVVNVGCVICLCLKQTVSEICFALVALMKIKWHL